MKFQIVHKCKLEDSTSARGTISQNSTTSWLLVSILCTPSRAVVSAL